MNGLVQERFCGVELFLRERFFALGEAEHDCSEYRVNWGRLSERGREQGLDAVCPILEGQRPEQLLIGCWNWAGARAPRGGDAGKRCANGIRVDCGQWGRIDLFWRLLRGVFEPRFLREDCPGQQRFEPINVHLRNVRSRAKGSDEIAI